MRLFNTNDVSWCFGVDSFLTNFSRMFSSLLCFGIPSIFDKVFRFLPWFFSRYCGSGHQPSCHLCVYNGGAHKRTSRRNVLQDLVPAQVAHTAKRRRVFTREDLPWGQSNFDFWSIFIQSQQKSDEKHILETSAVWSDTYLRLVVQIQTTLNSWDKLWELNFNLRLYFFDENGGFTRKELISRMSLKY